MHVEWNTNDQEEFIKGCCCFCTLGPHRLRHGARVPKPLSIDRSDDEQVDSIGSEVRDCELGGLHVVGHCLPAVTH